MTMTRSTKVALASLLLYGLFLAPVMLGGDRAELGAALGTPLLMQLYMLPSIIAYSREHHQENAIAVLNVALGWSGIGWIAALIWSATATRPTHAHA
jgi:hypothetical protein